MNNINMSINTQTICLNMIVKNESAIIVSTLSHLCQLIRFDYWVIHDTGSTDQTRELIQQFFKDRGIPGELCQHQWIQDFAYSRTQALNSAYNKTDYLLIFDADDRIHGNFKLPQPLVADRYLFKFGQDFSYDRVLLINNRKKWAFKSVLHEYLFNLEPAGEAVLIRGDYYVESGRSGFRSQNPNKYLDDAEILANAFQLEEKKDPTLATRYAFYCAQSYKDCGRTDNSIQWYLKCLELNGWTQEKYYATLMLGNMYRDKHDNLNAIKYWLKSSEYDTERIEGIVMLCEYYRQEGLNLLVNLLYHRFKSYNRNPTGKLFLFRNLYDDQLEFNNSICAYYVGDKLSGYQCCKQILTNHISNQAQLSLTLNNFNFYRENLETDSDTLDLLYGIDYILSQTDLKPNPEHIELWLKLKLQNQNLLSNTKPLCFQPLTLQTALPSINFDLNHVNKLALFYQIDDLLSESYKTTSNSQSQHYLKIWNQLYPQVLSMLTAEANQEMTDKLSTHPNPKIILTFTTCKRLDLFRQTVNSILNHWLDILLVEYWYCVDDNSSNNDRDEMQRLYPWMNFYFKNSKNKGHRSSMNLIYQKLVTLQPDYWIHMEDDFVFHKKMDYITTSLKGFEQLREQNVKQILFNRNYAETVEGYDIASHQDFNDQFVIHKYCLGNYAYTNCHYWPHYSFRPSMIEVSPILKLGSYNTPNQFFEMDYAKKWMENGYKSAFFNRITCRHIGRLTSDRGDKNVANAYTLNQVEQFTNSLPIPIKIINLKRRPDRKQKIQTILDQNGINNYEFIEAVDGRELKLTAELLRLFQGNDFGSRRGFIGCAMSHYRLYQRLVADSEHDYYLILEDDIQLCSEFKTRLESLKTDMANRDFIFLGYHMFDHKRQTVKDIYQNVNETIKLATLNQDLYIGGTFGYSVNKQGANKFLAYVEQNGIRHGIDYLYRITKNIDYWESQPHLLFSDWNEDGRQIDTDIQNQNRDSLDLNGILTGNLNDMMKQFNSSRYINHHGYLPIYERLFGLNTSRIHQVVEINTLSPSERPDSLNDLSVWHSYFPNALIHGFGFDVNLTDLHLPRIQVHSFNNQQEIELQLKPIIDQPLDLIFTRNQGDMDTQVKLAMTLIQYLKPTGMYLIENVDHQMITSYRNFDCFPVEYRDYLRNNCLIEYYNCSSNDDRSDNIVVFKRQHHSVYINGIGNLGDNLFQIAVGIYYAEKYGAVIKLNRNSKYLIGQSDQSHSHFDTIWQKFWLTEQTDDANITVNNANHCDRRPQPIGNNSRILIEGCSQSPILFKEHESKISQYLHLDDPEITNYILQKYHLKSEDINVLVSIKLTGDIHNQPNSKSYQTAIDKILSNVTEKTPVNLFIFSNLGNDLYYLVSSSPKYRIIPVDENEEVELYLGLQCNRFILSDNTLHYWIALLCCIQVPQTPIYIFDNTKLIERYLVSNLNWNYINVQPNNNWEFIPKLDLIGHDLYRHRKPLAILTILAESEPKCVCFNTLGFFKNHFDHSELKPSTYFGPNDGLFVRKQSNLQIQTKSNNQIFRIKMLCDWCSSEQLCLEWSNMCESDNQWQNLQIVSDDLNVDYYVIINKPPPNAYYQPTKTIVFQMEPWVEDNDRNWGVKTWGEWAVPNVNRFLAVRGRKTEHPTNAYWQLELTLPEIINLKLDKFKGDKISSICSSKYFDPGHIKRIDFLKYLENQDDIKLDIYSQDNLHQFQNYRGKLPYVEKSQGIVPYRYYFMVENSFERNYITEKLWEPILCETLVFYYGCPNLSDYIDPQAYVQLDIHDFAKSYQIIKTAIQNDWWSQRLSAIRHAKHKILNELAFFPTIKRIIDQDQLNK